MKKRTVPRQMVWGMVAGAAVPIVLSALYFLQPLQRVTAISCERVIAGTVGTCARIIQTYNRTGLLEKYDVELTPTNDGEFQGSSRFITQPLDAKCGVNFAAASWTADALVITTQSGPAVTCTINRSVLGSWL